MACKEAAILASFFIGFGLLIEGDSLRVINAVNGNNPLVSIRGIVNDYTRISSNFNYVNRIKNSTAHKLAKRCLRDDFFIVNSLIQLYFIIFLSVEGC